MTGPRVLLLSQAVHCIPPLTGAAVEQWIDAVAHRLPGCEPYVVSVPHPARADDEVVGGVSYHRVRIGRLYRRLFQKITRLDPWSYTDRIAAYARDIRPDIVHIHNAPHFVEPLKKGIPGARVILHMHNEKRTKLASPVDALVGCSDYISQWFQAAGLSAHRFATLPNGVDVDRFGPQPERQMALRQQHQIPSGRFVVLYVGRISPEKGPDALVEAFRRLPQDRFHLVLAGEWPRGNAQQNDRVAYAESLKTALQGLSVTVLGDFPPDRMPDIYRLGDLLAIPSRFEEPFSMVAIEAMASGLPVLALRRGGMAEYMVHGENAYVLEPAVDATAMAQAIESCANDGEGCQSRAQAALRMVRERFSWDRVAAATASLYEQLMAGDCQEVPR
ncbi:MAG TPA: glycosyltransferase [Rhodocyclaceae bacterium]|nr:glycosyltransferase [Rhodocyclaceae bacterium]